MKEEQDILNGLNRVLKSAISINMDKNYTEKQKELARNCSGEALLVATEELDARKIYRLQMMETEKK